MATHQRIKNLAAYCDQWREMLDRAEKHRQWLCDLQNSGVLISGSNGENLLQKMILEADEAAKVYKRNLTRMESLRDLASSGEDV